MEWGVFSWPKFIELLPVYVGGFGSLALLWATLQQVKGAKKEAASRAAFNFLEKSHSSDTLIRHRETFIRHQTQLVKIKSFKDFTKLPSDDQADIREYLNRYELLSSGILNNDICEKTVFENSKNAIIDLWSLAKPLIVVLRKEIGNPDIFVQFEKLASKWLADNSRSRN